MYECVRVNAKVGVYKGMKAHDRSTCMGSVYKEAGMGSGVSTCMEIIVNGYVSCRIYMRFRNGWK